MDGKVYEVERLYPWGPNDRFATAYVMREVKLTAEEREAIDSAARVMAEMKR